MTVLIVDDTAIVRMAVREILVNKCNIEDNNCFEADSISSAESMYHTQRPNLVILDISMPMEGRSGTNAEAIISLIKQFRALNSSVKIIMCSATADQTVIRQCLDAGAVDYLTKPLQAKRMVQAIDTVRDGI
ncbi:MAG: response regulator [Oscillospiraceae bacterium]|nr:response regulator [Oscillospiraceae bacterium]